MNVTGVAWRNPESDDSRFFSKRGRRPAPQPAGESEAEDEDIVEIHGEAEEESADGLDSLEEAIE